MAATKKTQKLTAAKLKALPWPEAVRNPNVKLSIDDTYRVGRIIVEDVHGGQRNTDKSRKEWSLRRIQEYVLKRASFATLARCVQTYEACRSLGLKPPLKDVRAGHLLNMTHLNQSKQKRLIDKVGKQGLSVQQLRKATGRVQGAGRRRKPGFLKALTALNHQDLLADLDQLARLDKAEGKRAAKRVAELQNELKEVQKQLKKHGF